MEGCYGLYHGLLPGASKKPHYGRLPGYYAALGRRFGIKYTVGPEGRQHAGVYIESRISEYLRREIAYFGIVTGGAYRLYFYQAHRGTKPDKGWIQMFPPSLYYLIARKSCNYRSYRSDAIPLDEHISAYGERSIPAVDPRPADKDLSP
jgi:hypothetical protein